MRAIDTRLAKLEAATGANAAPWHAIFFVEPDNPDNEFYGLAGDDLEGALAHKLDGLPAMRGIRCIEIVKPEKETE